MVQQEKLRAIETSAREQLYFASRKHVVVSRTFKGASFVVNQQVLCMSLYLPPWTELISTSNAVNGAKNPARLETVFSNLNQPQLEQELEELRENILTVILEPLTTSPFSYKLEEIKDSDDVFELRLTTSPQSSNASPVLDDLRVFTCFLSERLLPHLPSTSPFTMQLRLNIAHSLDSIILSKIVQKSLPNSLKGVPFCLQVTDKAIEAEKLVNEKLTVDEDAVSKWSDSMERWYEETRVEELLAVAREICETPPSSRLQIDAEGQDATEEDQGGIDQDQPGAEDNWDFDENDTWGFDDEKGSSDTAPKPSNGKDSSKAENDDDSGWGAWNDDDDEPETVPQPAKVVSKPKTASRLEKLSAKARTSQSPSSSQGSFSMPPPPSPPQSPFTETAHISTPSMLPPNQTKSSKKRDREVYTITSRATEILDHVEAVVQEASTLRDSNAFGKHSRPGKRGKLLFQTAPAACDMLRSFFPGMSQGRSSSEDVQLSCDFRYLSEKINAVYRARAESSKGDFEAKEESKWEETVEGLRSASEMCLQNAIVSCWRYMAHLS
jgi:centromere/kinetochore protein ZW10